MRVVLETPRLILRSEWKPSDLTPFAALNADERVMEYFPSTLTREETAAMIKRVELRFREDGMSFFACELKETAELIGFIGLAKPQFETHFTPCVEVGWRLAVPHWGKGYAVEGAKQAMAWGFEKFDLDEIVSFTAAGNQKSRRVMEKLGMTRDNRGDFNHPRIDPGDPLRHHVLYRITADTFRERDHQP